MLRIASKPAGVCTAAALGAQRAPAEPRQALLSLDASAARSVSECPPAWLTQGLNARTERMTTLPKDTDHLLSSLETSTDSGGVQSNMKPEEPAVSEAGDQEDIEFGLD